MISYIDTLAYKDDHVIEKNYNSKMKAIISDFENLKAMIEESIDTNEINRGEYIINTSYSDDLAQLYEDLKSKRAEIDDYKTEIVDMLELTKSINIIEHQQHGFIFEINKKEGDNAMRNSSLKYETITMKKGYLSFTTKKLAQLNEEFDEIKERYKIEQQALVEKVRFISYDTQFELTV